MQTYHFGKTKLVLFHHLSGVNQTGPLLETLFQARAHFVVISITNIIMVIITIIIVIITTIMVIIKMMASL